MSPTFVLALKNRRPRGRTPGGSITPCCAVAVMFVPAFRLTSQLPQSPPFGTSWVDTLIAPISALIVTRPAARACRVPNDLIPSSDRP